jgi:arabinose-5-phosphate isomerase
LNAENTLLGIITDGDLRRMLQKGAITDDIRALDILSPHPKTIRPDALAIDALALMREYSISQLVVLQDGEYLGIVHLHDLLKEGLV